MRERYERYFENKLQNKKQKRMLLMPLWLVVFYLVFTVVLYAFGPFNWITYAPVRFYTFLALYLAALILGYILAVKLKTARKREEDVWNSAHTAKYTRGLVRILGPLLVVCVLYSIINLFREYGFATLDFGGLFKSLWISLKDVGQGYLLRLERMENLSGSDLLGGYAMTLFNLFWSFFAYSVVILCTYLFRQLSWPYKILLGLWYLIEVVFFLSIGTNIGIFRVLLVWFCGWLFSHLYASYYKADDKKEKRRGRAVLLGGVGLVVVVLVYFLFTMVSRGGILYWKEPTYNLHGITVNLDSVFFDIVPASLHMLLVSLGSYLTQGYYAFSLALRLPWRFTYGVGFSMALVDLITEHYVDINVLTYQHRIESAFGWPERLRWHSIYTWVANDVGWYGVIVFMFLLGFFFAMVYKDAVRTKNPFAKALMPFLFLTMIFIPCNYQVMQSLPVMCSFLLLVVLYVLSKFNGSFLCVGLKQLGKAKQNPDKPLISKNVKQQQ